ncbi:MAG: hypothetical protein KGM24_15365, partial [Elusimicrobia bacterium]|nr:hypothetical protein [Elusimicrobiota bacterium]
MSRRPLRLLLGLLALTALSLRAAAADAPRVALQKDADSLRLAAQALRAGRPQKDVPARVAATLAALPAALDAYRDGAGAAQADAVARA